MEIVLCQNCKNYFNDLKCQAFPSGIPDNILLKGNDHAEPLKGQKNEIVFEEIK